MNTENAKKVRLFYGVFLGVLTVVIAILFIVEASQIYYSGLASGGETYSREIVAERLYNVMVPTIFWIVAAVVGYVLSVLLPYVDGKKRRPDAQAALKRLKRRIPQGESEEFLAERKIYRKFAITRLVVWLVAAGFAVASAIIGIVYLANTAHFAGSDPTGEILSMLRGILPWMCASFLLFMGATVFDQCTAKKELESAKRLLVIGKGLPMSEPSPFETKRDAVLAVLGNDKTIWIIRAIVLALAVTFIVLGIVNGGMRDVFIKAVAICRECIGLG